MLCFAILKIIYHFDALACAIFLALWSFALTLNMNSNSSRAHWIFSAKINYSNWKRIERSNFHTVIPLKAFIDTFNKTRYVHVWGFSVIGLHCIWFAHLCRGWKLRWVLKLVQNKWNKYPTLELHINDGCVYFSPQVFNLANK